MSVEPVRERWKALAFSPDGSTLAAAGYDHGLVLWDTATWAIRHKVPEQNRLGAEALAFTRRRPHLAVSLGFRGANHRRGHRQRSAAVPEAAGGNECGGREPRRRDARDDRTDDQALGHRHGQEKTPKLSGHGGSVESVAFSPDGTTLATASSDHTIKLWDLATRRERMTLEGHTNSVQSVAFSPDGKSLASIGFAPEVILWDVGLRQTRFAPGKRRGTWARRVRFSPDGRRVAAETLARNAGRHVGIWDVATGKQSQRSTRAMARTCCLPMAKS